MKLSKYVLPALGAGLFMPAAWLALYSFGPAPLTRNLISNLVILVLWPSFILMVGDPTEDNFVLQAISVLLNVLLYGALGVFAWLCRERLRVGLWPAALAVLLLTGLTLSWALGLVR